MHGQQNPEQVIFLASGPSPGTQGHLQHSIDQLHHTIGLGVVGHGGDVLDPLLLAPVSSRAILLLDHVEGRGPAAL